MKRKAAALPGSLRRAPSFRADRLRLHNLRTTFSSLEHDQEYWKAPRIGGPPGLKSDQFIGFKALQPPENMPVSAQKLRVMVSESDDPFFNLATEEWIFRDIDPDYQTLFLWRNRPCVVIGANQNPWKECRLQEMEEDGIELVRRQSGGGAVYQDYGNSIFTFLSSRAAYDKNRNTKIITDALRELGVDAQASGRNDIVIDVLDGGRYHSSKVSGSAFKLAQDRAFHHGTLLVDADLTALGRILNPNKLKLQSKGVASVKARVTNLKPHIPELDHHLLNNYIISHFFETYDSYCEVEVLNAERLENEPSLMQYYLELKDYEWRFGKTPQFTHNLETRFDWGIVDMHVDCSRGNTIEDVTIYSDSLYPFFVSELESALAGVTYDEAGVKTAMDKVRESLSDEEFVGMANDVETWMCKNI